MQALLIPLIILLIAAAIYWGYHAQKKRRELMQRIASELGARFSKEDPYGLSNRHDGRFSTLNTGSNRYAYNVVHGKWEERSFWLFDHHYETYSHSKNGRQTHHHHRTFLLAEHDSDLGSLDVRPEGFFD